jgi:hypothetical protein
MNNNIRNILMRAVMKTGYYTNIEAKAIVLALIARYPSKALLIAGELPND